jgi:hypothetical protein
LRNVPLAAPQLWPHIGPITQPDRQILASTAREKHTFSCANPGGQGRDRTGDLSAFQAQANSEEGSVVVKLDELDASCGLRACNTNGVADLERTNENETRD